MSSDEYNIISHYQQTIKHARKDESRLLHCLRKLFELQVTINHLQMTGIGKTVNSLRKYSGEVGSAAKSLVAKWKSMVAAEEISKKQNEKCEIVATDNLISKREFDCNSKLVMNINHVDDQTKFHQKGRKPVNSLTTTKKLNEIDDCSDAKRKEYKPNGKKQKTKHAEKHNLGSKSALKNNLKAYAETSSHHSNNTMSSETSNTSQYFDKGSVKKSDVNTTNKLAKGNKSTFLVNEGIDSSMGASFSEALGLCTLVSKKKLNRSQKYLSESKDTTDGLQNANSEVDLMPEALKTVPKCELDIVLPLSTSIPKISKNYKASLANQNVMNYIFPSTHTDKTPLPNRASLNIGIVSKTMRTKVYSGVKTGAVFTVPSLFDICIRILQKNIDALEYTGGVPFDVLRPVLERTTPQQLLSFEDYNSYLLADTDVLWERHVGRHFRGEAKPVGETWREMFLRCENEKERRLSILTNNIKISQKQSALPVRKTRLAFVDNVAKPPRHIQRAQQIFGTNDKLITSPAARVAALSSASYNAVKSGDPRLKISRDTLRPTGGCQFKTKKAPLMAKTLQSIKKRYKR